MRRSNKIKGKGTIGAALGALKSTIKTTDQWGREVTVTQDSRQLMETTGATFAMLQRKEPMTRWDVDATMKDAPWYKKFGMKAEVALDRVWKTAFTKKFHDRKERIHGINLSAAAGIEGVFEPEALSAIDREARQAIKDERVTKKQKFVGAWNDFWHEVGGQEQDLHKKRVEITAAYREKFLADPFDKTNPLYGLIMDDVKSREDLAGRIGEAHLGILHAGEKQVVGIELKPGNPVHKFIVDHVYKPAIMDALANPGQQGIHPKLRVNIDMELRDYFQTPEFQAWKASLPKEQQEALEDSVSYATDLITQTEELVIPEALDMQKHGIALDQIDFEIELTLGTARFGPNGEVPSDALFGSENRVKLNDEAWKKIHARGAKAMVDKNGLAMSIQRSVIIEAADMLVRNEGVAGLLGFGLGLGIKSIIHSSSGILAPITGGLFAGASSGIKEYANLRSQAVEVNIERALGHSRVKNAVKYQEMAAMDVNQVDMGLRAQQLGLHAAELSKPEVTVDQVVYLMGLTSDSMSRSKLGDQRGTNLLHASFTEGTKDSPANRANYRSQLRLHDLATGVAGRKINELLKGNEKLRNEVAAKLGMTGITAENTAVMMSKLTESLMNNLEKATTVDTAYQLAIGAYKVDEAKSVVGKNAAREKWRRIQAGKKALYTAGFSTIAALGMSHFTHLHEGVVSSGVETHNITLIPHEMPTHSDNLMHGVSQFTDPNGVVTDIHANIPFNTNLVEHVTVSGQGVIHKTYDLVGASGTYQETLASNIRFDEHGRAIIDAATSQQLAAHHINFGYEKDDIVEWVTYTQGVESSEASKLVELRFGDLPGNESGIWGWVQHNVPGASGEQTNGVKHFIRAAGLWSDTKPHIVNTAGLDAAGNPIPRIVRFADTIHGKEWMTAGQSNDLNFRLPEFLSNAEGQKHAAQLIKESIEWHNNGMQLDQSHMSQESLNWLSAHPGQKLDEIYRIAYEAGHTGTEATVPDQSEFATISEYFMHSKPTIAEIPGKFETYVSTFTPLEDINISVEEPYSVVGSIFDAVPLYVGMAGQVLEAPVQGGRMATQQIRPGQSAPSVAPINPAQRIPPVTPVGDKGAGNLNETRISKVEDGVESRDRSRVYTEADLLAAKELLLNRVTEVMSEKSNAEHLTKHTLEGGGLDNLGIINVLEQSANKLNLPIAYIMRDNKPLLLTRGPLQVEGDPTKDQVFYFNFDKGAEDILIVDRIPNAKGSKHSPADGIRFSGASNFPNPSREPHDVIKLEYTKAFDLLADNNYDLRDIKVVRPEGPKEESTWLSDVVDVLTIATAAHGSVVREAPPTPPKSSETDVPKDDFVRRMQKNLLQIGTEFSNLIVPGINVGAPSEAHETQFDNTLKQIDINATDGSRQIRGIVDKISDVHKLPLVYIINGGRIRVLTRKPDQVDVNNAKLYYYDPEKGEEQELNIDTSSPDARLKTNFYLSPEANFGAVEEYKPMNQNLSMTAKIMEQSKYNYKPSRKLMALKMDEKIPAWTSDLILGLGFAITMREGGDDARSVKDILDEMKSKIESRRAEEK